MATEQTQGIPNNPLYGVSPIIPDQELTDDGAITLLSGGVCQLNKAGAIAATLAVPAQNGVSLTITSKTAQAHTVTVASGLYGLGTGSDVGTFGGAIGDSVTLVSYGGYWTVGANLNVTFA
jgi:hypothetical protein